MILTDSSVVIEYLRRRDATLRRQFATLTLGVCGVVRAEVLCGAKDPDDRRRLIAFLGTFHSVPMSEETWDAVGDNNAILRRAGLIVPYGDLIVATLAIRADIDVWARDAHFPMMQRFLPALRLFVERP